MQAPKKRHPPIVSEGPWPILRDTLDILMLLSDTLEFLFWNPAGTTMRWSLFLLGWNFSSFSRNFRFQLSFGPRA